MKKRAFLAIAIASNLLNSSLPALAQNKAETTDSVVQKIVDDTQMTAEVRAYYLLRIASDCLADSKKNKVAAQYAAVANGQDKTYIFMSRRWEAFIGPWADQVALEGCTPAHGTNAVASAIIQKAVTQLDKSSNKLAKLNLYFIASRLFQKAGNNEGMQQCNKVLNDVFASCEKSAVVDEDQTSAAISVLNIMANGLITVNIPDFKQSEKTPVKPFSEKEFIASEKLKLRGIAMADRLDTKSHTRRKAHRDLALWYLQLGKTGQAEKQKLILFDLVGFKDDDLLYPQSKGCGQLVWWEKEKNQAAYACGMG